MRSAGDRRRTAGLVAATEATARGLKVIVLDQEGEQNLGGQAFWSLGGLFFVDSPEQRFMRVRDSLDLARQDWMGSAQFDRPEDHWPRQWAEAYLNFAAGEKRAWLHSLGMRWFPVVGWAERGGSLANGHGNSVPRFHITWGTGPGVLDPFVRLAREAEKKGLLSFRFRHQVDELITTNGAVTGARGTRLAPDPVQRGGKSNRDPIGDFEISAGATLVASGGIGGNHDLVRKNWRWTAWQAAGIHGCGRARPCRRPHDCNHASRARLRHQCRPHVALYRGPAELGPDLAEPRHPHPARPLLALAGCRGQPLPAPRMPGFDTLATLKAIKATGYDYSWFILTKAIIKKEFALSGSEQNPDLTGKDIPLLLKRLGKEPNAPVKAFMDKGADFVVRDNLEDLVEGMNALSGEHRLDTKRIRAVVEARDREIDNTFSKDAQVTAIRGARNYLGDKIMRTAKPHRLLDPTKGPLIAVRLNILTRKTLGGLQTDLQGRVLEENGNIVPGLYAAGEVAGFGGGGYHGYNALEGTFLGGCIFSGRVAGRSVGK